MDRFKLNSPLPSKELKLFKKAMKCYEQKKYKNGLKYCRQIISNVKYQKHPDTLAVQSLMLYLSGQKEEALKSIKLTLTYDFKNSLSWHAFSIINKYNRNYEECVKCLHKALKYDNDNNQLLMELGSILLHIRDFSAAVDCRYNLLKRRSGQRQFWLSYTVSLVLADRQKIASNILNGLIESLQQNYDVKNTTFVHLLSNVLLFQIENYCSQKQYNEAAKAIIDYSSKITDTVKLNELKAIVFLNTDNKEMAVRPCIELLKNNCENVYYYDLLASVLGYSEKKAQPSFYYYLIKLFPDAILPQLRYLELIEKQQFIDYFSQYFLNGIKKGQLNLFNSVSFLYRDLEKVSLIEQEVLRCQELFKPEPESLWILYFLAQHYSYIECNDLAMDLAEELILKNPDFVDIFIFKSDLLKKLGKRNESVEALHHAHTLDPTDRYVISLYSQALIKNQQLQAADDLLVLTSTKSKSAWEYMNLVHCTWYFQELSKMFLNSHNFARSIDICMTFEELYKTYEHDPMDFHMYCMRKGTLSPYVDFQKDSPTIRSNKFFLKIARTAILGCTFSILCENLSENVTSTEAIDPKNSSVF